MPVENLTDSNVWEALFEHTPTPIRYLFGVLTLGLFTLAGLLWRWNREDVKRVEDKIDKAETERNAQIKDLHERIDRSDREVTHRLDEVNVHLIQIASNTNRSQRNDQS